jgi:hypothetical protein
MPTIFGADGFRVYFYSHEPGEPPHVHLDRAGASAKVWLQPVALAANSGFPMRDLGDVLKLVRANQKRCLEAWHAIFDTSDGG